MWDPDRFLERTLPLIRLLFGPLGLLLWLALVIPSLVLAGEHWTELTDGLTDRLLAMENLLVIALVFPIVKAFHELGHGYAVKAGGGEVHEIGLMFLVLLPVPYVDASAASAFRSKWRRAGVGAAGILVETFLAAIMMQVWVLVEPGIVRSVAFNAMAIAGISTVLFNGNPLLRFDGYFILCDLVEIPNLAGRATAFWKRLVEGYAFGRKLESPMTTFGERVLFLLYTPASLTYRVLITISIALLMAQRFLFIGVLIAVWFFVGSVLLPIWRWSWSVGTGQSLSSVRGRAVTVTLVAVSGLACVLGLVPVPLHTVVEGIVWLPEESIVRAGEEGFAKQFLAMPGSLVETGKDLVRSDNPDLAAELAVDSARVAAAEARLAKDEKDDPVQAGITRRELDVERSALTRASERSRELDVKSKARGLFIVPRAADLSGRFHRRGEVLGYVVPSSARIARVIVSQNDVGLVRQQLRGAEIRLASDLSGVFPARLLREVPAASDEFPSEALTLEGGGSQAVDRRDPNHPKALNRLFQFDVELSPEAARSAAIGAHVWVRFDHGFEPMGFQWWRRIRQLFLSRFDA